MGRPAVLKIDIITDAKRAADGVEGIGTKLGKFGKAIKIAGAAVAASAIGTKVVQFAKESVQAASDLEQSMGAVESVFKSNAPVIERWAKSAATNLGLATAEAAQMAAVTGAQLQGLGFSLQESTTLTQQLTQRAADMAAVFGGTTAEALEAVGSLLRGERDPIEKYGVSIKQTGINAVLAAKGQDKLTGSAKTQAEAVAAVELLMKQTASATGAFRKEEGTLAVQQQKLTANITNTKAALGQALLPALVAVTRWLNTQVVPAIMSAWRWFQTKMAPAIRSVLTPALRDLQRAMADIKRGLDSLGIGSREAQLILKAFAATAVTPLVATIRIASVLMRAWASAFAAVSGAVRATVDAVNSLISALGRIRVPKINWPSPPSWLGSLNPFAVAPPSIGAAPAPSISARAVGARTATSSGGIVINVTGALDPDAVAKQIHRILSGHDRRIGGRAAMRVTA